jgi:hypothetical protein
LRDDKVKVLYIAGGWRSGSTLLDNVLGQIEGFFSGGEIVHVWEENFLEDRVCGCGAAFRECPVWRRVTGEAYGDADLVDAEEMVRLLYSSVRTRHVPLMLMPGGRALLKARLRWYLDNLENLYQGIGSATGSRVVVDSSKAPLYGYMLETIPSIDLYVVHLVRDPRAVAYSWLRKKWQPDKGFSLPIYSPVRSALTWDVMNLIIECFRRRSPGRYLKVRYEDFMNDPKETVGRILDLVQKEVPPLPFLADHRVELGTNHTVSGNPVRFMTGTVELKLDDEWQEKMKRSDKNTVTGLTLPLLFRYGYLEDAWAIVFRGR